MDDEDKETALAWVREGRGNELLGTIYKDQNGNRQIVWESTSPGRASTMRMLLRPGPEDLELRGALSQAGIPQNMSFGDIAAALDPGNDYEWWIKAEKVRLNRWRPLKARMPSYKMKLTLVKRREGRQWVGTKVEDAIEIIERANRLEERKAAGDPMKAIIADGAASGIKRSQIFADLALIKRLRAWK